MDLHEIDARMIAQNWQTRAITLLAQEGGAKRRFGGWITEIIRISCVDHFSDKYVVIP